MSRVDSAKIAASKANQSLKGAVVASDAFFPFRDGLDEIAPSWHHGRHSTGRLRQRSRSHRRSRRTWYCDGVHRHAAFQALMKSHVKTYGCQMNEQDSLHMRGLLAKMGYEDSDSPVDADLILLVGCSIREKAVHKVYSDLGRIRPLTEINEKVIVGVAVAWASKRRALFLNVIRSSTWFSDRTRSVNS
jgi:hypothetical protein